MNPKSDSFETFLWNEPVGWNELPTRSPIRILDDWWRHRSGETGKLPARRDVDPIELGKAVIPWIFIMAVIRDGDDLDYLYRLVGTANAQLVGRDATGMLASDIFRGKDRAVIKASFDETVEARKPTYWRAAIPHEQEFSVSVYRAIYPLSDKGETIDHLIAAAIPESVHLER